MKAQKKQKNTPLQEMKQQRLMAALRANLRKRKTQVKARLENEETVQTDIKLLDCENEDIQTVNEDKSPSIDPPTTLI